MMSSFEILCVTMHQNDFSKIRDMNIHSDVVFANQADRTAYDELEFEGHRAKMITTSTRGVGVNRNLALMYAQADICLFADDDVLYVDDMETRVVSEFDAHPDADVIIFHFNTTDPSRLQRRYSETRKYRRWERMPWAGFRIAVRLNSVRKANVWFTSLFGGGCVFPSGEDSMWLNDAKKAGLTFYVSKETIGTVSFEQSSWFTGFDEKFYYGKGVYYESVHPGTAAFWLYYSLLWYRGEGVLTDSDKLKWMKKGRDGYRRMLSYDEYRAMQEKGEH